MAHTPFSSDAHSLAETLGERLKTAADRGRDEVERVLHSSARTLRKMNRRRFRDLAPRAGALARRAGDRVRSRPVLVGAAAAGLAAVAGMLLLSRRARS